MCELGPNQGPWDMRRRLCRAFLAASISIAPAQAWASERGEGEIQEAPQNTEFVLEQGASPGRFHMRVTNPGQSSRFHPPSAHKALVPPATMRAALCLVVASLVLACVSGVRERAVCTRGCMGGWAALALQALPTALLVEPPCTQEIMMVALVCALPGDLRRSPRAMTGCS